MRLSRHLFSLPLITIIFGGWIIAQWTHYYASIKSPLLDSKLSMNRSGVAGKFNPPRGSKMFSVTGDQKKWPKRHFHRVRYLLSSPKAASKGSALYIEIPYWLMLLCVLNLVLCFHFKHRNRTLFCSVFISVILIGVSLLFTKGSSQLVIRGETTLYNSDDEETEDRTILKQLHGIEENWDAIANYIGFGSSDFWYESIGVSGGHMELVFDKQLWIETIFQCSRKLSPDEIDFLMEDISGHWLDGYGSSFQTIKLPVNGTLRLDTGERTWEMMPSEIQHNNKY